MQKFFWLGLISCYFLQVPFRGLAKFISIFALLFLLSTYRNWSKIFSKTTFCVYALYLSLTLLLNAFRESPLSKIIRFSEILYLLPIYFCMSSNNNIEEQKFYSKSFVRIAFLKFLFMLGLYIFVLYLGGSSSYRNLWISLGWGDVYTMGSVFFTRIQLHGNALLVIAAFVAWYIHDRWYYKIGFLIAVLLAGNKAFLIGIFGYAAYFFIKKLFNNKRKSDFSVKITVAYLMVMLFMPLFYTRVNSIMKEKADYSNAIRKEQSEALLSGNIVFGNGIGNTIHYIGRFRDYSGYDYYELQSLYIINQIGFVGYFLFYILTFGLMMGKNKKIIFRNWYIYLIYIIYSFFNPYCFDTSHMIVGIIFSKVLYDVRNKK